MASLSTLQDGFNGSFDSSKWTRSSAAQVVVTDGVASLSTLLTASYPSLISSSTYDLTGTEASLQLVSAGDMTLASYEVYPLTLVKDTDNLFQFTLIGGTLKAIKKVGGSSAQVGSSITYDAGVHRWLRIREASGSIYWEWSTEGVSWTSIGSCSTPFVITAMSVEIVNGTWGAELDTTSLVVDNFNFPLSVIASYSEGSRDIYNSISSYNYALGAAQTFTVSSTAKISACSFYMDKNGSPTGNAVAKIYNISGTYGEDSIPTGTALAASDNVDVSTLTAEWGSYEWELVRFTFSGSNQIILEPGYYAISCEFPPSASWPNMVAVNIDTSSPSATGNIVYGDESWVNGYSDDKDMYFVLEGTSVADYSGLPLTVTVPPMTATALTKELAEFDPPSVYLSPSSLTAAYEEAVVAEVSPAGITAHIPEIVASSVEVRTAEYTATSLVLNVPSVAASFGETVAYEPLSIQVTVPSMTGESKEERLAILETLSIVAATPEATALLEMPAEFTPLEIIAIPAADGSYEEEDAAAYTPIDISLTIPANTAAAAFTANLDPLSVLAQVQPTTATAEHLATYITLIISLAPPEMTASHLAEFAGAYDPLTMTITPIETTPIVIRKRTYINFGTKIEYYVEDKLVEDVG